MKTALIVPYFGKLPNYFQLFLDSCACNPGFDWLIFSDDTAPYAYPQNVHFHYMTFSECHALVQSRFDFPVTLHTPQKLCDYKCAYGYIFQNYLGCYDWWGHCDLDQVFGDLGAFITADMLTRYDKIGSIGHLTLYRNTPENNMVFQSTSRYRDVFTTERGQGFDEWLPDNINDIYLETGRPVWLRNAGADVNSYHTAFRLVDYDLDRRCYTHDPVKNSIFYWNEGKLTQIYEENKQLQHREFPYVHLQKRAMEDARTNKNVDSYYIIPNRFVDSTSTPNRLLITARLRSLINTQFVKVKFKSLRYRLKTGDWAFSNVFRKGD